MKNAFLFVKIRFMESELGIGIGKKSRKWDL